MLRSLYSGISGLRSHQTMLDVTGNNIANVNTTAFKSSAVQFQDTLSQLTSGARFAQANSGGTNPAQVGLGVQVAGIATNLTQGSTQSTGKNTDMLITGDGYFVTKQGNETTYTRAGSFGWDSMGRLTTADGSLVQGWTAVNGVVSTGGTVGAIQVPRDVVAPAKATTGAAVTGNLPADAAVGDTVVRDIQVYNGVGAARSLTLTFAKTAAGWNVSGTDGTTTATGAMTFTNGTVATGGSLTVGGVTVDLSKATGYAGLKTATISSQNGSQVGALQSFSLSGDGTLVGSFSNGATVPIAQLALASFVNPGGLEKAGESSYRASVNSGDAVLGTPGTSGLGSVVAGALEMSNVDLSQEFTNLIVAQRGFQANARIITTSDEVLQELTNLKR
ncbi:flagellar hook protein FlgE [Naasia aerilata]|uniref:Flagellar hook protein FlgE n=1 Tax=Naasia aerilata TaxID=1162966 RepID=A0ABN6XN30_9MICO|nr:flagellar hook protein FlgE [Naasia aerilata]BDZ45091.1 flagellar hook protein FlgE [Naasia aerilata]